MRREGDQPDMQADRERARDGQGQRLPWRFHTGTISHGLEKQPYSSCSFQ
jgi:hypothetical protein